MKHWAELFPKMYLPEGAVATMSLRSLWSWGRLGEAVEAAGVSLPIRAAQYIWRDGRWEWRFNEQCRAEPMLPHFTMVDVGGVFFFYFDGIDEVNAELGTFAWLGRMHKANRGLSWTERRILHEKLTAQEQDELLTAAVLETAATLPDGERWASLLRRVYYTYTRPDIKQHRASGMELPLSEGLATSCAPDPSEIVAMREGVRTAMRSSETLRRAVEALAAGRRLTAAERQALSRFRRRK